MAKQGSPLKKGEILLSGAFGPMAPIKKGDRCFATISGLGDVEVGFE
jgi:2-keto-4-pentenoate hydratase